MAQYYSRVTRKGQATIPSALRKRFGIEEGDRVAFEATEKGLVLKPMDEIEDSAGALSGFADARKILDKHLRHREKGFR